MSSKGDAYRQMVEEVIAGGLLEDDEIEELRDMLARVERQMRAKMPAQEAAE
jgi:hypothetical protein